METIKLLGCYFREGLNRKREMIFVGKKKVVQGDKLGCEIVLANPPKSGEIGIDVAGRWDVECRAMDSGKGWVVTSATYSQDKLEVRRFNWGVEILINGERGMYRDEEGRRIFLSLDFRNWFNPEIIKNCFYDKLQYLQLDSRFDPREFLIWFEQECVAHEKNYKKMQMGKLVDPDERQGIDKLMEKWQARG